MTQKAEEGAKFPLPQFAPSFFRGPIRIPFPPPWGNFKVSFLVGSSLSHDDSFFSSSPDPPPAISVSFTWTQSPFPSLLPSIWPLLQLSFETLPPPTTVQHKAALTGTGFANDFEKVPKSSKEKYADYLQSSEFTHLFAVKNVANTTPDFGSLQEMCPLGQGRGIILSPTLDFPEFRKKGERDKSQQRKGHFLCFLFLAIFPSYREKGGESGGGGGRIVAATNCWLTFFFFFLFLIRC